jgi:hypothetical protein
MESRNQRFPFTNEGYKEAKEWLQEIGKWESVSTSGASVDGYSIVESANSFWNKYTEDNKVENFYLDPNEYTNAVTCSDVKEGDIVVVFDLNAYRNPPATPCTGTIVEVNPYPFIVVDIKGKKYEVYESGFGFKLK